MTKDEMMNLINRSLFAMIGYTDEEGRQNVRRVFCVWHRGLGRHLISTNTSSSHVQSLKKNGNACLYSRMIRPLKDCACSENLNCISRRNTENFSGMQGMKNTIPKASKMRITVSWNSQRKAAVFIATTGKGISQPKRSRHTIRAENLRTDTIR